MADMNIEEKQRFEKMEQSVQKIEKDISEIKSAIVGNDLTGDNGMIGKVGTLEKKVQVLSDDRIQTNTYFKFIGVVLVIIITAIIKKYLE
jgi:energy-converting hydrogenase Eha subunit B